MALNADGWTLREMDKRPQAAEDDYATPIVVCGRWGQDSISRWHRKMPTISSKVFEGNAGSLLNTGVTTVEEAEDWTESTAFDASILFLRDFCKYNGGPSLKIDVFGKRECFQCRQWRAGEEIGIHTIWGLQLASNRTRSRISRTFKESREVCHGHPFFFQQRGLR